jgi:hypothetical protein
MIGNGILRRTGAGILTAGFFLTALTLFSEIALAVPPEVLPEHYGHILDNGRILQSQMQNLIDHTDCTTPEDLALYAARVATLAQSVDDASHSRDYKDQYELTINTFIHHQYVGDTATPSDELRTMMTVINNLLSTLERRLCRPRVGLANPYGGGWLGGELAKNTGRVRSIESLATTDVVTNRFTDYGDPLGVGIVGGYNFKPWNNNFIIGPFASFDYLSQTINHNFAGGQFLGTTTHWFINAGAKAGFVTVPGFYFYGLAGAAFLNQDLNVNFATAAQSNVTTPGFTLGLGAEYRPPSWKLAGHPISLFAQYQHTWWGSADFNTPASSPAFNYAFRREDNTFKLGVNFYFGSGSTPPPAAP